MVRRMHAEVEDGSERQELQGQCQVVWLEREHSTCLTALSLSLDLYFFLSRALESVL